MTRFLDKVRADYKRMNPVCPCGHGMSAHGLNGCEGVYTTHDGTEPGPCYCHAHVCGPLCIEHGDVRDTSYDPREVA